MRFVRSPRRLPSDLPVRVRDGRFARAIRVRSCAYRMACVPNRSVRMRIGHRLRDSLSKITGRLYGPHCVHSELCPMLSRARCPSGTGSPEECPSQFATKEAEGFPLAWADGSSSVIPVAPEGRENLYANLITLVMVMSSAVHFFAREDLCCWRILFENCPQT